LGRRFWIELQPHSLPSDVRLNAALLELAHALGIGVVATNGAHYARREGQRLYDVLTCVRRHVTLPEALASGLLHSNSECYLKPPDEMAALFADVPRALDNAVCIAERCQVRLDFSAQRLPEFSVPKGHTTPDIDVDFAADRREEVIQYVYERYGGEHVGMVCNVITYRARSALRDAAKALAFPADVIDRAAKALDTRSAADAATSMQTALAGAQTEDTADLPWAVLAEVLGQMESVPRHLSIHSGGMLITAAPLAEIVPLERAARRRASPRRPCPASRHQPQPGGVHATGSGFYAGRSPGSAFCPRPGRDVDVSYRRAQGGGFCSLQAFCHRTRLPRSLVENLIRAGAMEGLGHKTGQPRPPLPCEPKSA
jgi:DNA polymerase III alpha subunit